MRFLVFASGLLLFAAGAFMLFQSVHWTGSLAAAYLSKMILKVVAIESIEPMAFVSLLFNDSNQISCRKSLPSEPPDAIAGRQIANGESIIFDSGQDTDDLLRPHTKHYEPYPPTWLVAMERTEKNTAFWPIPARYGAALEGFSWELRVDWIAKGESM